MTIPEVEKLEIQKFESLDDVREKAAKQDDLIMPSNEYGMYWRCVSVENKTYVVEYQNDPKCQKDCAFKVHKVHEVDNIPKQYALDWKVLILFPNEKLI